MRNLTRPSEQSAPQPKDPTARDDPHSTPDTRKPAPASTSANSAPPHPPKPQSDTAPPHHAPQSASPPQRDNPNEFQPAAQYTDSWSQSLSEANPPPPCIQALSYGPLSHKSGCPPFPRKLVIPNSQFLILFHSTHASGFAPIPAERRNPLITRTTCAWKLRQLEARRLYNSFSGAMIIPRQLSPALFASAVDEPSFPLTGTATTTPPVKLYSPPETVRVVETKH